MYHTLLDFPVKPDWYLDSSPVPPRDRSQHSLLQSLSDDNGLGTQLGFHNHLMAATAAI